MFVDPVLPALRSGRPFLISFAWTIRLQKLHWPFLKRQSPAWSPSHLTDPKEFKLDDLERQPQQPPTLSYPVGVSA